MVKRWHSILRSSWLTPTLCVAALYFIGGMLVMLPFQNQLTNLFWPPAGFAFVALWWFGKRAVSGVLIGSVLVSTLILGIHQPAQIVCAAIPPPLEALLAVWWLRKQSIGSIFNDAESILKFILAAVLVAPIPAATFGTTSLWLNGLQPFALLPQTWLAWWVGDSMGVLLIAPFLLSLASIRGQFLKVSVSAGEAFEFMVAVAVLFVLWADLFMAKPTSALPPLSFVAIPLIIWIAIRFNIALLNSVLLVFSLLAIHSTSLGEGPFVRGTMHESIAYLYGFLWVIISIGLFLGVTIAHNRRALASLAKEHLALETSQEGLRKTLENTPNVAVQWFDVNGRILYWNQASENLYGWRQEEALGKTLDQLIYAPETAEHFSHILKAIGQSDIMVGPIESTVRNRDGKNGHIVSTIFAMPEVDGIAKRFVCMDVDITQVKQAEADLQASNNHLAEAQRIAKLGSWEWDILANRFTGSEESYRIWGIDPSTQIDFSITHDFVHPDDKTEYLNAIARDLTYPNTESNIEFRIIRPDGEVRVIHSRGHNFYDAEGRPIRAVGTIHDVTELRQAQAKVEQLAYYDELTGLPNRALLLLKLTEAMESAANNHHHVALLFVDFDHFKTLNDTHGHEAGDLLLKEAASRIRLSLYNRAIVARPGGDEFGIILTWLEGGTESAARTAMDIAEKIREALTFPFDFGDHFYHTSASIGAVVFPGKGEPQSTLHDMLKQADTALFRAKDTGRNAISLFESHMQDAVNERLSIEQDLREALGREQLRLYLQPQLNEVGHIVGAECLLRWDHPEHGLMSPAIFIPVAENTGLIVAIGKWVLFQACLIIARLDAAGQNVRISVNVSPRQFRQHDFVMQVKELLRVTGAEPQRLILEITESVVVENVNEVIARMSELEHMGIGFSIDDFGTGYSSLSYLKHMPLRELKIDKSFVDGLPRDRDDGAIVGSILALARNLGLEVVAEGIETQGQLEYLKAHGCQVFQGYLHGRPVASEELVMQLLAR